MLNETVRTGNVLSEVEKKLKDIRKSMPSAGGERDRENDNP